MKRFIYKLLWLPLYKKWDRFSSKSLWYFTLWNFYKETRTYRVYYEYSPIKNPPIYLSEIQLDDRIDCYKI